MGNWTVNTPLDTDFISLGDDNIREMKTAIQEALRGGTTEGTEAIFPGSAPTTAPVFRYRGLKGATGARPSAGQYGLFFDTTRSALQRDNGSSWDDIGTLFPSGTKMVFYQASAPTGWTAESVNDKFLRVVTAGGTGGTTGGTVNASDGFSHSHKMGKATGVSPVDENNYIYNAENLMLDPDTYDSYITNLKPGSGSGSHRDLYSVSTTTAANTAQVFAYADVIIAQKD